MNSDPESPGPDGGKSLETPLTRVLQDQPGLWQFCHTHQTAIPGVVEMQAELKSKIGVIPLLLIQIYFLSTNTGCTLGFGRLIPEGRHRLWNISCTVTGTAT